MKLKVEINPKEWMQLMPFILVAYLIISGKAEEATKIVVLWFRK